MELRERRIVVTGASRGIGEQLARRFAAAGARVALVARSAPAIEALAAELGGVAYPADLTDRGARPALIERIEADGAIDILVNNAGVDHTGGFAAMDAAAIDEVLELNLHAPLHLCRAVVPLMLARRSGHIVNISSYASSSCLPGVAVYSTSKAGLSHFTACLRGELTGSGIGTTLVELGPVETEMIDSLRGNPPTTRALARLKQLRLIPELSSDRVAQAIVNAVRREARHLRMPKRSAAFPMMTELPRRLGDLLIAGVDRTST